MNALQTQPEQTGDLAALFDATSDREAAWKRLWQRHGHACFRIAVRLLRSEADAWAVVNAAWLKASEELDEGIRDFGAWIATITRNQGIDFLRQGQRRAAREHRLEAWHHSGLLTSPDPAMKTQTDEALTAVLEGGGLTKDERSSFLLRALGGHSYEEISAILGKPLNSISVYIHRARKKLRSAPHVQRLLIPLVIGVAWLLRGAAL